MIHSEERTTVSQSQSSIAPVKDRMIWIRDQQILPIDRERLLSTGCIFLKLHEYRILNLFDLLR